MRTWLHTLSLTLAATTLTSCGMRTLISPEADQPDQLSGLDAGVQPCGFGPPCDVNNLGGRVCESLGLGPGDLACDPTTCKLVLTGCSSAPGVTPGQTGMGTPGMPGGQMPGQNGGMGPGNNPGAFFGGGTGGAGAFFGAGFFGGGNPADADGGTPNNGFFGGNNGGNNGGGNGRGGRGRGGN